MSDIDSDLKSSSAEQYNEEIRQDPEKQNSWKILVVDDEESIHAVTRLALKKFQIESKPLEFLHAYSAKEAIEVIQQHPDLAVILLDVVMESQHAGLDLVKYIREELKNDFVRIILRTGQPGQAPELKVIKNYQIDDYRLKTELTRDKLFSVLMASIRTYEAILKVETHSQHLEAKVRERTAEIEAQKELLTQQKAELLEANQTKSRLFSILSHDLRAPLGTLQTLLSIAEKGILTPESISNMLAGVRKNTQHLNEMLEKLLNWANTQISGFHVQTQKFELSELYAEFVPLQETAAQQKNILLEIQSPDDCPPLMGDTTLLLMVFNNLLNNAIKFTPEGGSIQLEYKLEAEQVRFSVADTGVGLNHKYLTQLKENQLLSTLGTAGEKGTGIGLIIVREFVKMNKGSFDFENRSKAGARFYFTQPLASESKNQKD